MATLRLEFIKGTLTGKVMEVTAAGARFGRDESCEVRLDEALISRQHARIKVVDGKYIFEDLGSTNGVRVNGVRLRGSMELTDGDHVKVGETELIARCSVMTPVGERTAEAGLRSPDKTRIPELLDERTPTALPTAEEVGPPRWIIPAMIGLVVLVVVGWLVAPHLRSQADPLDLHTAADPAQQVPPPVDSDDTDTQADDMALPPWGPPPVQDTRPPNPTVGQQTQTPPTPPVSAPPAKREARYIWVDSKPSGATVTVNGTVRGTTPLFLDQLAPDRYSMRLTLDGYAPAERIVEVPNDGTRFVYSLPQERNTCLVQSDPPGAAIMHGSQVLGYTPAIIPNPFGTTLLPVRLTLPFHTAADVSLRFEPGAGTTATASLAPQVGTLEVKVVPAGATVYLDDFDKGEAPAAAAGSALSDVITYTGLNAGEHEIYVSSLGIKSDVVTVTVEPGVTAKASVMLWLPDTELSLADGSVVTGLIVAESPTEIQVLVDPKKMRLVNPVEVKRRRALDAREAQTKHREMLDELRRQEMQRKLEELRKNGDF